MCDGTPCPCNLLPSRLEVEHRKRHPSALVDPPAPEFGPLGPWTAIRLRLACWWRIGHCWHHAWSGTAERRRGRWYCCECPTSRDWDPSSDCRICVGPGCGVAP